MKKVFLLVIIILILGGLGYLGLKAALSGPFNRICKTRAPLFLGLRPALLDNLCEAISANTTLKCNFNTHTCENFAPLKDSGDFKIILTVDGRPGKKIEIDLWFKPSPGGESLVKNTDEKGVAFFKGIPPGVYYPSTNLTNFPKQYGNASETWTWESATIVKGKATEMKMDLHSSP